MTSHAPVEGPLACEPPPPHAPTSAPEFSPLAGIGPDLELPADLTFPVSDVTLHHSTLQPLHS
jgi:hypothetical protein